MDKQPIHHFKAKLTQNEDSQGTYVVIPVEVQATFGVRGRVPVRGTINGYPFRTTVSPYAGIHYLGVNRALREGARVKAGEVVEITIERDDQPRVVNPPADLTEALAADQTAQAAWDKLSYTHQKEYALAVEQAKKPETRLRRIKKTIEVLSHQKVT